MTGGGAGEPVLLLLHGLGATADVWDGWRPLLAERWPGRWLAPDLPGHGGSAPLPRVSGLAGLLPAGGAAVTAGLREHAGGWRLALDPKAFAVGAPDLPGLLAACRARVVLARGETDPMVGADQLAALRPDAVTLPGLGHNAHVEDPAAVLALLVS